MKSNSGHVFYMFFIVLSLFLTVGCQTTQTQTYIVDDMYDQAKQAYQEKNYTQAISYYETFLKDHPNSPLREVTLYYIADCYKKTGEIEKAKKHFAMVIQEYPNNFWSRLAREDLQEIELYLQSQ